MSDNKKEKNDKKVSEKKETKPVKIETVSDDIVISPEVVATIAGVTISKIKNAKTTKGPFFDSIPDILKAKDKKSKGIKVEIKGSYINIFVNILVNYGVRIPDVAFEVQKKVKENVENMTGLEVKEVNVNIQGLEEMKE